jgi:hypothetical protein
MGVRHANVNPEIKAHWDRLWHQKLSQREITKRINEQIKLFRDSFALTEEYIEKVFRYIDHIWGEDIIFGDCQIQMKYKVYHDHVPPHMKGAAAWVHDGNYLYVNAVLLKQLFETESHYYVGGIQLTDSCSILMHILLHEYVHVFLYYARRFQVYDWKESHGPEFMRRVGIWYGHTDFQHSLIPGLQENRLLRSVQVGDKVKVFVEKGLFVIGPITDRKGNELKVEGSLLKETAPGILEPQPRKINGVVTHVGRIVAVC